MLLLRYILKDLLFHEVWDVDQMGAENWDIIHSVKGV